MNVEFIASRFHGALAAGHLFAAYYNVRKRNWIDVGVHIAFAAYDMASAYKHDRQSKEQINGGWKENIAG